MKPEKMYTRQQARIILLKYYLSAAGTAIVLLGIGYKTLYFQEEGEWEGLVQVCVPVFIAQTAISASYYARLIEIGDSIEDPIENVPHSMLILPLQISTGLLLLPPLFSLISLAAPIAALDKDVVRWLVVAAMSLLGATSQVLVKALFPDRKVEPTPPTPLQLPPQGAG